MTLTTISTSTLDTIFNIIRRKEAWKKEGEAIKKLEAIYQSEISKAKDALHRTRTGELMTVQSMDDDHLFNTIKMYMSTHHDNIQQIPRKYLEEAKVRPGMLEKVIAIETVIEPEEFSDW
jgi:hypothetical protein